MPLASKFKVDAFCEAADFFVSEKTRDFLFPKNGCKSVGHAVGVLRVSSLCGQRPLDIDIEKK